MSYDLFVSYAREDNGRGRVTELVKRIRADFADFAGRPLAVFFDVEEIRGMEDWELRILGSLKESRLLLACLSPSYLASNYCAWEVNEYLNHEIDRACFGDGVASIYFIDVPGWEDEEFGRKCLTWVAELRRRQHFDLRPWYHAGEASLQEVAVRERMGQLNAQLNQRVIRSERAEQSIGNIDSHNLHFSGRTAELRCLREQIVRGRVGVLTAVHGLGGIGKTALAIEYAHAFAHEYGGGRWQVRCEGKEDLLAAVGELAAPLGVELNDEELRDAEHRFGRVVGELRRLAMAHENPRCLLLLDNVDRPRLLDPAVVQRLPAEAWLHVIVTTRLGPDALHGGRQDRVFIAVDELKADEALELIESYQPDRKFPSAAERDAARKIVDLLGRFALAVEAAAVFLGRFAGEVSCAGFLSRLEREGVCGLDHASGQAAAGIRHGEARLAATLESTLERLDRADRLTLACAALLPPDHIALPWIRPLVAQRFPDIAEDAPPGYPDPWRQVLRRLFGLRLLQQTTLRSGDVPATVVKMHRLVGEVIRRDNAGDPRAAAETGMLLGAEVLAAAVRLSREPVGPAARWALECLHQTVLLWLQQGRIFARDAATFACTALRKAGIYRWGGELAEAATDSSVGGLLESCGSAAWFHNMAGVCALSERDTRRAESHFRQAATLSDAPDATDQERLETATNMACLLIEDYQPMQALEPARAALALAERLFPGETPEVALRVANLAVVMQDLCRLDEALALMQRVLRIHQASPPQPLRHCQDLGTYASMLRESWRDDESLPAAQQALELARQAGLDDHPVSIGLCETLARTLADRGEWLQARHHCLRALHLALKHSGESSRAAATCHNNLGANSLGLGRHADAVEEFQRALAIDRSHASAAQLMALRNLNLAIALLADGRPEESRSHLHEAWRHKSTTRSPDLVAARLIFTRLTLAMLTSEPADVYLGQLRLILNLAPLPAARADTRWAIGRVFKALEPHMPPEQRDDWRAFYHAMKKKPGLPPATCAASHPPAAREKLWAEWPQG